MQAAHDATRALRETTAALTTALPLFEAANARIAELLALMDRRRPSSSERYSSRRPDSSCEILKRPKMC